MSRRPSTAAALVALLAIVAAACTGGEDEPSPTPEPIPVKVAFLHDLSVPGSTQSVAPALLGLQLALEQAAERGDLGVVPEVVGLDVEGDDAVAVDLAHEVVDDPSYVAVVIGPFWSEPVAVGDVLDAGGVATLSLSGLDPTLASNGWSSWRRLVGGVAREAASLSSAIRVAARSVSGTCLVGDGTGFSDALGALVATNLGAERVVMSVDLPGEDALAERRGRRGGDGVRNGGLDGLRSRRRLAACRAERGRSRGRIPGGCVGHEDGVVPGHHGRSRRRHDRHVHMRRPEHVHQAGGPALHP